MPERATGKIWDGNQAAAPLFDGRIHKPELYATTEHAAEGHVHRAELSAHIDEPTCSPSPVLDSNLNPADTWWSSLRTDLARIEATPTDRVAVRQEWVDRSVPRFLGREAPTITSWTTAHGDLHTANLTLHTPYLLDWEGFGRAPAGYDAAMLLAYSLLVPDFVAQVRRHFPVLATEHGRAAQLVVATELMQSIQRGDFPELLPALQGLVASLT